jgi:aminoglycoside phosphotransferase (APT) family kinase protein
LSIAKMHADELDIDVDLVKRLIVEQFPDWAELPVVGVEPRGTDNALYRLGDNLVVRLPRRERTAATLEKERRWLPKLEPLPLTVPTPIADGVPAQGFPWSWVVYRWIRGSDATSSPFIDPRRAAEALAEFLLALRAIDPTGGPPPGAHNFYRGELLENRDAAVRASIEALRELDVRWATASWESALQASAWDAPPVWIHGDLDSRNLVVDSGELAGVIDWGGLGVGDPACDVMVAWKVFPVDARDVFRRTLSVDEETWVRARGWALSQALNALSYYTMESNPVLVTEARQWLARVRADEGA